VNNVLDVGKNFGFTNASDHATTPKEQITWADFDRLVRPAILTTYAQERAKEVAIQGYAYLPTYQHLNIENYLVDKKEPLLITIGLGSGFNNRGESTVIEQPSSYSSYHALLLIGYDIQGNWQVFDSLGVAWYWISKDYELLSVTSLTELPIDWKVVQETAQKEEFGVALNHYGKARVLQLEVASANAMMTAFTKSKNQSVFEAAGRFWTVYINAVAYGKYSVTDIINDCYNWRRTGKHSFNLNTVRG
jgi:hypothetical protein